MGGDGGGNEEGLFDREVLEKKIYNVVQVVLNYRASNCFFFFFFFLKKAHGQRFVGPVIIYVLGTLSFALHIGFLLDTLLHLHLHLDITS